MKKKAKPIKTGKKANPPDTFTPNLPVWEEVEESKIIELKPSNNEAVARAPSEPLKSEKMEQFSHAIIEGKNQSDAYRAAYNAGKMKNETIWRRASELMSDGRVAARIAELRRPVIEKLEIDTHYLLSSVKEVVGRCMQVVPVMQGGKPVIIETEAGDLAPAYAFNPKGALQGLDMLYKHKGLYEKDNRQQQTLAGMSVNVRFVDAPEQ